MFARELAERREFHYPPFFRLIHITLQHKDDKVVLQAATLFGKLLRQKLGERVLGPVQPHIPRIRNYYGQNIMLKLEKSAPVIRAAKEMIRLVSETVTSKPGWSQVRVGVDVDPV